MRQALGVASWARVRASRLSLMLRVLASLVLFQLTVACGATGVVKYPEAGKYAGEGVPLVVVVDRADSAKTTSKEVERLLTTTPVDEQWPAQLRLANERISALQKDQAARLIYDSMPYTVLPSVVWAKALPEIKNEAGTGSTLLGAISPEIGSGYTTLLEAMASIGTINAQIEEEEKAKNAPGVSDADEKAHEDKIEAKKLELEKAKEAIEPTKQAFLTLAKNEAARTTPEVRTRFGETLVNLQQALHDAHVANISATIRFPFVATSITGQLTESAKASVADYVYERTGKRLKLKNARVEAKFDGQKVTVDVSGMTQEDLDKIEMDELVAETISRTGDFSIKVLTLLATTSSTADRLDFETDLVEALLDGFKDADWSAPDSVYVPGQTAVAIQAGTPPPPRAAGPFGGLMNGLSSSSEKQTQ